jgi:dephospho-CoA kinase
MSAWPGKFVIGLTGNIATGKSVVRKMFEHLGAYGIDADALAHRAIAKGAPGYKPVVEMFGKWLLDADGQIDRSRLGKIVFSDPDALARLEAIVHPLVREAVDILIRRSKQNVIIIEAIKLLESPIREKCDRIVVAYAPEGVQLNRLVEKRKLSPEFARQRIAAQPPQREKITAADIVIRNDGSYEDTWLQVSSAWQELFPHEQVVSDRPSKRRDMLVERARPGEVDEIATFINRHRDEKKPPQRQRYYGFLWGEGIPAIVKVNGQLSGLAGWQVENLVSRTDSVYLDPAFPVSEVMPVILNEVERSSRDLQCEISLLFLPPARSKGRDLEKPGV